MRELMIMLESLHRLIVMSKTSRGTGPLDRGNDSDANTVSHTVQSQSRKTCRLVLSVFHSEFSLLNVINKAVSPGTAFLYEVCSNCEANNQTRPEGLHLASSSDW